ncbi:TPA: methionine--tRNA ligase [Candidatus Woesearchaeota archaeon]|nr:methionine--tRNA ligase [Candidatus Woesearchaeota archaeon]
MVKFTKKQLIITSALPYANGPIHIGHLVEYIQTDIFVRFLKLKGEDAVYCCADDTHGTAIELKAHELSITPEELITKVHKEHLRDFTRFHISFDSYYSTNSEETKALADRMFHTLKDKGFIYTKDVETFYDEEVQRFLPDRYVKGECPKCAAIDQYGDVCEKCNASLRTTDLINPYSVISGKTPVLRRSKHYFFRLSDCSEKIEHWLTSNNTLQPEIVNYVRNWITEGLQDWDISRDGPYFGFRIPGEDNKYYYVWLDAPIGYISSYANYCKNDVQKAIDGWNHARIIHFIGKDIIYFHFLFWPAMLMEAGFTLPEQLVVHGFLTVNGEKMSKSRGTFLTAAEFADKYNPECLRFYYAKMLSKKMADIDLDFNDFRGTTNNELVANVGNFCYRALSFLKKNFDGRIGSVADNRALKQAILGKARAIADAYEDCNTAAAVKDILAISQIGNRYFQEEEPWKHLSTNRKKMHDVLGLAANIAKIIAITAKPILPRFSEGLEKQLNLGSLAWDGLHFETTEHTIGEPAILIGKMEEKKKETFPLQLMVAQVVEVKEHPEADKLYVLQIDAGNEKRQLVAGLREHYAKEQLQGKKIIIVANLKPAKLRGILSEGMLLAGVSKDGQVGLLTINDAKPGTLINAGGLAPGTSQVRIEAVAEAKLTVKEGRALFKCHTLRAGNETVRVEKVEDGAEIH